MKLLFQSYSNDQDLNTYGGLEVRFSSNWAHWFKEHGHEVKFVHQSKVNKKAKDFDYVFDAPTSTAFPCPDHPHTHSYFSPEVPSFLTCGQPVLHPTFDSYQKGMGMDQGAPRRFAPIPYPANLLPKGTKRPFDRDLIIWANKGSFTEGFGEHRHKSSIAHLRVLAQLAKRAEFTVVFGGDAFVDSGPYELEIRKLLQEIPNTQLGRIPWIQLVELMSRAKLSLNPGGITGCVFEAIYAGAVPVLPKDFGFFPQEAQEAALIPNSNIIDEAQIYGALERLWVDRDFYNGKHRIFQNGFIPHRECDVWGNYQIGCMTEEITNG